MRPADLIKTWLYEKRWSSLCRFLLCTALGVFVWNFASNGFQETLIWICFLYALFKMRKGAWHVWRNSAGIAFVLVLIYMIVSLPVSTEPVSSIRDFIKLVDVLAAVFAISIIFGNEGRIRSALFYTALALTCVFTMDLIRLSVNLRADIFKEAHFFQPFFMSHPNNASMAAGCAALLALYFVWYRRNSGWQCCAWLVAVFINVFYLIVLASRGPQFAFAVTVALSGLVMLPGWRKKAVWLLIMCVAGVIVITQIGEINPRFKEKNSMAGLCERNIVWQYTWELSKNHPVIGHGYGKRIFQDVYYSSNPPEASFIFPHPHEYWLYILFSHGWLGLVLYAGAWALLAIRIVRHLARLETFRERALPGMIALLLVFIHVYGLGDWPTNIVYVMLLWLIPAALVVTNPFISRVQANQDQGIEDEAV